MHVLARFINLGNMENKCTNRGAGSNLERGGGGGSISKKGTFFTLANTQKSLTLKK